MNKDQILATNKRVKEAWKKIRDVFIDVHLGDKIQRSIDRGNSITSVAESNIRKLKSARIQTGAIESRLAEFRKYLEDAQEAVNSGDYVAAQDALRSARNSLNELKTTHDKAIEVKT